MSNNIAIKDFLSRLESDINTILAQEVTWKTKVIFNNLREYLKVLEGNADLGPLSIISNLNRFLDSEEEKLNNNMDKNLCWCDGPEVCTEFEQTGICRERR